MHYNAGSDESSRSSAAPGPVAPSQKPDQVVDEHFGVGWSLAPGGKMSGEGQISGAMRQHQTSDWFGVSGRQRAASSSALAQDGTNSSI